MFFNSQHVVAVKILLFENQLDKIQHNRLNQEKRNVYYKM